MHHKTAESGHSDRRTRRLTYIYEFIALGTLGLCLGWAAVFAAYGTWHLVIVQIFPATVAAVSLLLIHMGRLNAVILFAELSFLVFAVGFSLVLDVPTAEYPRVAHQFLLVLAMCGYLNYVRRKSLFQLAIIAADLVGYVALASTNYALVTDWAIPDDIRPSGAWINTALVVAMLCGAIYSLERNFSRMRGMSRELVAAIRNDHLELFYQPQVDHTGSVTGAEALLRWRHPKRGQIAPDAFISVAEEGGLMPQLGTWVLRQSAKTLATWRNDPALAHLTLAVNVSASQFNEPGFVEQVSDVISLYGIDPTKLKLELTESVLIAGMEPVVEKMGALSELGITFALDDFGTGYSSLSYLHHLPITQLKIDRSFIRDVPDCRQSTALVNSIVKMGNDLGLQVLAEGVENLAQQAFLLHSGCREFQGYYFGRPEELATFEARLHQAAMMRSKEQAMTVQLVAAAS